MSPSATKKEEAAQAKAAAQAEETPVDHAASDDDDDEEEAKTEQVKSKADESSAMDKLTDMVEEKQMDENKMKEAFQALRKQEEADKEAERKREKALAAVKVSKDDVALIALEMELTTQQADRKLREADGNVVDCLKAMITA